MTIEDDRIQLLATSLIGRVTDSSLGMIVHSQTAYQMIQAYQASRLSYRRQPTPVTVIPQLMPVPRICDLANDRGEFNLPKEALIFGILGTVHPTKEPHLVLRAFTQLSATLPNTRLVFVGVMPDDHGVPSFVRDLGMEDRVIFLGRVDPIERMHHAIAACDVIINLRQPTIGETSSAALRAMALGRPVLVRDVGGTASCRPRPVSRSVRRLAQKNWRQPC